MTTYLSKEAQELASRKYYEKRPVVDSNKQERYLYSDIFSDKNELSREDLQRLLDDPTFYSIGSCDSDGFDVTIKRMETDDEYAQRLDSEERCLAVYNKRLENWQKDIAERIAIAEERAHNVKLIEQDQEYKEFLRLSEKFRNVTS